MIRFFAVIAFGAVFVIISPPLRLQLMGSLETAVGSMEQHSPYSYVGLGVLAIGGFIVSLSRSAAPR